MGIIIDYSHVIIQREQGTGNREQILELQSKKDVFKSCVSLKTMSLLPSHVYKHEFFCSL
jgi:hypothetical protein